MPSTIAESIQQCLSSLQERHPQQPRIVVTAGPTCEDIDAVRFITNRSTGHMGVAVAEAASARGWPTLLIHGPVALTPPADVGCVPVRSAAEMLEAVLAAFSWCTCLIMTAAVADYTPADTFAGKRKKSDDAWMLPLKRTQDILATVAGRPDRDEKCVIGFALETDFDQEQARKKMESKALDALVLNTPDSFGAPTARFFLMRPSSPVEDLGAIPKTTLAQRLLDLGRQ